MRAWLFLLAVTVVAAADPVKDYRRALGKLKSQEHRYWGGFRDRYQKSLLAWETAFEKEQGNLAVHDFEGLRALFSEYAPIHEGWGRADLALAESGSPKAFSVLLKEFLSLSKGIDAAQIELAEANALHRYVYDQEPGLRLDGLQRRLAWMVKGLAKWPALSTRGWERAVKFDARKSIVRRVAVIDAAAAQRDFLRARLQEKTPALRIAAIEALVPLGSDPVLHLLLDDNKPVVRRALLQEILRAGTKDTKWIGPVLRHLDAARGLERTLCIRALGALTKQTFGDAPAKWAEWYADYRKEIEGGRFDREQIEVQEAKPAPSKGEFFFYGAGSTSRSCVFVVEGSRFLLTPAAWKVRAHKRSSVWWGEHKKWHDNYKSQLVIMRRELDRALQKLPDRWGLVVLEERYRTWTTKALIGLGSRDIAKVNKKLKRLGCSGWCSPGRGLEVAAALDPDVDTVFLLNTGMLRGGRFLTPEALLAWFVRWNRFRRLVVNTLRYDNGKEASEMLLRGIAEASGGHYAWLEEPPK